MPITPPPIKFDGKFSTFYSDYVERNLPDVDRVIAFDKSLRTYLDRPDALHVIRLVNPKAAPQKRGSIYVTPGGRIRPSDNAPVWWLHAFLMSDEPIPSNDELEKLFVKLPCHMFQIGSGENLSRSGYHAAHIMNAKNGDTNWKHWDRQELIRRVLVNIHPCNMFLTAKTGWPKQGGRPDIISWVIGAYRQRYMDTMERFLDDVGYRNEISASGILDPDYSYGPKSPPQPVKPDTENGPPVDPAPPQPSNRPIIKKQWVGKGIVLEISTLGQKFVVPHDALCGWVRKNTNAKNTASWIDNGIYSWPWPTKAMLGFLAPYRVNSLFQG